jgi:hypothetical protein
LKVDEVRRSHLMATEASMGLDAINADLHELEIALDRGRKHAISNTSGRNGKEKREQLDLWSLEVLVNDICGDVSGSGLNDGLLAKVRGFNQLLENVASML